MKIGKLGESLKYRVMAGGIKKKFDKEWLFDLIWYIEDEYNCLKKIPLIVESELQEKYESIKYDFEKLLAGNAEKRLFICKSKRDKIVSLSTKLKNAIDIFEGNTNTRFLIVILESDNNLEFNYFLHTKNN